MGSGIITTHGVDPLVAWQTRVHWFRDAAITAAITTLLSGSVLVSEDGVLEVSWLPMAEPDSGYLFLRRPGGLTAEIVLRAVGSSDLVTHDRRDSRPAPDRWQSLAPDGSTRWELFNCVTHRLRALRS